MIIGAYTRTLATELQLVLEREIPGFVFSVGGSIARQGYSYHDIDYAVYPLPIGLHFTRQIRDSFVWLLKNRMGAIVLYDEAETQGYGFRDGGQTLVQVLIPLKDYGNVLVDFFFERIL